MRYTFTYKSINRQHYYEDEYSALVSFKKMFGTGLNWLVLRSLVGMCVTDFTFENDKFILKGVNGD